MTGFERWVLWTSAAATTLTGVVYLWMRYFMEPVEQFAAVNHPLQPLVLKAHILVSPLLVFALGMISVRHVWNYFANGSSRGRHSGIVTASIAAVMIGTGYLIQAVTAVGALRVIAYVHIAVGIVFAIGFLMHMRGLGEEPTEL
jgi:hypothetical protein